MTTSLSSAKMASWDAIFLSDLHLKSIEEPNARLLLNYFLSLSGTPTIFLLGDIFDLWVSDHRVFVQRWQPLLDALKSLKDRGSKMIYFEGNHDMHLAPYWRDQLGADVRTGPGLFSISGLRIRCEHGDQMNLEDHAYLRLRAFLRHPAMESMGHSLPGKFWDWLGQKWSAHSRMSSGPRRDQREENIRATIRKHAESIWEKDPFDVIISGHMHVKDDWIFKKSDRSVRSINLGSWFEAPQVLVLKDGQFQWMPVTSKAEDAP